MVEGISYNVKSHVIESLEAMKRTKNYEERVGSKLFQRLFDKCPQAKILFRFPIDMDVDSPELLRSKRFLAHAAYVLEMIDQALNMLGPDIELLTEIMLHLGRKHVRYYRVKPEMFPIMGEALIYVLQDTLGDEFTEGMKESWEEIYNMIRAMVNAKSKR
jgi:hemoglobin-like flavoprotein